MGSFSERFLALRFLLLLVSPGISALLLLLVLPLHLLPAGLEAFEALLGGLFLQKFIQRVGGLLLERLNLLLHVRVTLALVVDALLQVQPRNALLYALLRDVIRRGQLAQLAEGELFLFLLRLLLLLLKELLLQLLVFLLFRLLLLLESSCLAVIRESNGVRETELLVDLLKTVENGVEGVYTFSLLHVHDEG